MDAARSEAIRPWTSHEFVNADKIANERQWCRTDNGRELRMAVASSDHTLRIFQVTL